MPIWELDDCQRLIWVLWQKTIMKKVSLGFAYNEVMYKEQPKRY